MSELFAAMLARMLPLVLVAAVVARPALQVTDAQLPDCVGGRSLTSTPARCGPYC